MAIPRFEAFHSTLLEERLGPRSAAHEELTPKHEAIAASLQRVTEEIIFHLLRRLHDRAPNDRVVLVGGCAMNSVANGKVTRGNALQGVYVPAGAADNGTSFGSAYHVWHAELGQPRTFRLDHACWGDDVTKPSVVERWPRCMLRLAAWSVMRCWMKSSRRSSMERSWAGFKTNGVRSASAGKRSLLADPRRTDMRDLIN